MCTLTIAWQAFADTPVAVVANRDEALDRPSKPPSVVEEDPGIVAPVDEEAGGTWLGYNEHGVLVALTNRWVDGDLAGDRSRGLLVREALRQPTAEDATRFVERELDEREYEGFNLVLADENAALYVEWDGHRRIRNLDPGVHVVVNVGIDGEFFEPPFDPDIGEQQADSARRLLETLQPEPGETATNWLDRAADAIADHDFGVCVHEDRYGTRSSSLIAIGEQGTTYRFADGPPCETPFRPVEGQV
ncbi:NRDE family protein [Haloarculaceae archaeon H-GB2-1]|nr:NRDE family protein [Haloarculaceae archaeon H-GB1-1]MEA5387328.1 NRDE family protein [Haloarculaceae archaeon H-GB11]MEA5408796.1 NRDE family protein [Haloarculaceae archaeon H-GB2-1]